MDVSDRLKVSVLRHYQVAEDFLDESGLATINIFAILLSRQTVSYLFRVSWTWRCTCHLDSAYRPISLKDCQLGQTWILSSKTYNWRPLCEASDQP